MRATKLPICAILFAAFSSSCLFAQSNDTHIPGSAPSHFRSAAPSSQYEPGTHEILDIRLDSEPVGTAPKLIDARVLQADPTPSRAVKIAEFQSADFAHRRLLFEEPMLERHGVTKRAQPLVSEARFFTRATVFPLHIVLGNQRRCDSSLGWGTPSRACLSRQR